MNSLNLSVAQLTAAALARAGLSETHGAPLLEQAAADLAAQYTLGLSDRLLAMSPDELREHAYKQAERYVDAAGKVSLDYAVALACRELGRQVPGEMSAQFQRVTDPTWLARQYRTSIKRVHEHAYQRAGLVAKYAENYVSNAGLAFYREYQAALKRWQSEMVVFDTIPDGEGRHRQTLLANAVRSEEAKDAKTYAFLRGIEELSVEAGLQCALTTLTLESKYHPNPTTGESSWDGSTMREAHLVLAKRWQRVERDLHNAGIALSGARFAEVHGDGCPHWHVWMHYAPEHRSVVLRVLARHFTGGIRVREIVQDDAGDLRSRRTGIRFQEQYGMADAEGTLGPMTIRPKGRKMGVAQVDMAIINRAYSNGASYAAKYATKTMKTSAVASGQEDDDEDHGRHECTANAAERVQAARWIQGYRGYQFFGIRRCLSAWDELYRAKTLPTDPHARALYDAVHNKPGKHSIERRNPLTGRVETVEVEGGTTPFLRLLGGLAAAKSKSPVPEKITIHYADGFENRYGEPVRKRIGVRIYRHTDLIFAADTREPGRYVIRRLDGTVKVADGDSESPRAGSRPPAPPSSAS